MTTAPIQRVGLHELTQLLDGDVTCPADGCDSPATHIPAFTCCGITAPLAGCLPHCENAAESTRALAASHGITCAKCHARVHPSHVTVRPI